MERNELAGLKEKKTNSTHKEIIFLKFTYKYFITWNFFSFYIHIRRIDVCWEECSKSWNRKWLRQDFECSFVSLDRQIILLLCHVSMMKIISLIIVGFGKISVSFWKVLVITFYYFIDFWSFNIDIVLGSENYIFFFFFLPFEVNLIWSKENDYVWYYIIFLS